MRQFIVVEQEPPSQYHDRLRGTIGGGTGGVTWESPSYRVIGLVGSTYNEDQLRKWAHDVFGVPLRATMPKIAAAIAKGGWMMLERIDPET
jgi:hypothetical protein